MSPYRESAKPEEEKIKKKINWFYPIIALFCLSAPFSIFMAWRRTVRDNAEQQAKIQQEIAEGNALILKSKNEKQFCDDHDGTWLSNEKVCLKVPHYKMEK